MCAIEEFRRTFRRVRRELSLATRFGKAFPVGAADLKQAFREEMAQARVPATPERLALVDNWVGRAVKLGGAA